MARTGRPRLSDGEKMARGTFRKSRSAAAMAAKAAGKVSAAPSPTAGNPAKPNWLTGRASELWDEKVARYRTRGQNVAGFESMLAQFCALEAMLITAATTPSAKKPPTSARVVFLRFAQAFHDTPASQ